MELESFCRRACDTKNGVWPASKRYVGVALSPNKQASGYLLRGGAGSRYLQSCESC
jgi:hypothetical protein